MLHFYKYTAFTLFSLCPFPHIRLYYHSLFFFSVQVLQSQIEPPLSVPTVVKRTYPALNLLSIVTLTTSLVKNKWLVNPLYFDNMFNVHI